MRERGSGRCRERPGRDRPGVELADAMCCGPRKRRVDPHALRVALAHRRALRRRRRYGRRQLGEHHDVHLREHAEESRGPSLRNEPLRCRRRGGAHRARAEERPGLRERGRRFRRSGLHQGPRHDGRQAQGRLRREGHRRARHRRERRGREAPEGSAERPRGPRHREPRGLLDARRRDASLVQRRRDQDVDLAARRVLRRRQPSLLPRRGPQLAGARVALRTRR
ncbi:MAG: hypothetical protein JWO86_7223 [Myxococcaceae bacterium]|nr:hypothetical protein [Myxococcaceae bacterium]